MSYTFTFNRFHSVIRPRRVHEMQITANLQSIILGVCQSVSLSVTLLCYANTAELIDGLLGLETLWNTQNIIH